MNPEAWPFVSWQNNAIGAAALGATVGIAVWFGRTPLEAVHPPTDRAVVDALQLRFWPAACAACGARARARCGGCRTPLCRGHATGRALDPRCPTCRGA